MLFFAGKLEELPEIDRKIYFPETSKSHPVMHVQGNPTFSLSYRLVDFCYNITLVNSEGTVELKPPGSLQCTFRIYMPYGNRVALKLQTGDENDSEGSYIFTQEKKQLQALFPAEYHKIKHIFLP